MTVSVGDVFRASVEFSMPSVQKAFNVLGLKCTAGSATDAQLLTAVDSWLVTAYAFLQGTINNQVDIVEAVVTRMAWNGTIWAVSEVLGTLTPVFGATGIGDMLPHATAGVVTFQTAVPKRRGRTFLPGFGEAEQAESDLVAGAQTALGNWANALTTVLLPGTANVYYAVLGNDGNARTAISYTVNSIVGSQRRRKPGVGV